MRIKQPTYQNSIKLNVQHNFFTILARISVNVSTLARVAAVRRCEVTWWHGAVAHTLVSKPLYLRLADRWR